MSEQPANTTEKLLPADQARFDQLFRDRNDFPVDAINIFTCLQIDSTDELDLLKNPLRSFEEYYHFKDELNRRTNPNYTPIADLVIARSNPDVIRVVNELIAKINAELPSIITNANEESLTKIKAFQQKANTIVRGR